MEYSNISDWILTSKPHQNRLSKAHHVNNYTLPQIMPSLEPVFLKRAGNNHSGISGCFSVEVQHCHIFWWNPVSYLNSWWATGQLSTKHLSVFWVSSLAESSSGSYGEFCHWKREKMLISWPTLLCSDALTQFFSFEFFLKNSKLKNVNKKETSPNFIDT